MHSVFYCARIFGMNFKIICLFILLLALPCATVKAVEKPEKELQEVGIVTKLGTKVDLSLELVNSVGKTVTLKELIALNNKPIVIVPAYYNCPRLCGLVLDGVAELVEGLDTELGKEYSLATVSFDPKETFDLADAKAKFFQKKLANKFSESDKAKNSWHFLVGKEKNVNTLMEQLGFLFKADGKDFSHSAAIFILSTEGYISQYFTGIQFSPWDVHLALVEASHGAIGSLVDQVLLYCFRFDPTKGKYTAFAQNIMRLGGVLTLILIAGLYYGLRRKRKT